MNIDNYLKYEWIKCSNQKTENGWIDPKSNACIYAFYKRLTSDLGTHTGWKWEGGKRFHGNQNQKKARVATLILDK